MGWNEDSIIHQEARFYTKQYSYFVYYSSLCGKICYSSGKLMMEYKNLKGLSFVVKYCREVLNSTQTVILFFISQHNC